MATANDCKEAGNKALSAEKFKEAVEHYSAGIALEPDNHVLFSNRSAAYCKLEEFGKALDDANKCVKINPKWGKGWSRKASALEFLGRHDDALEAYDEGIKNDPENKTLQEGKTTALKNVSRTERTMPDMFGAPDVWTKLESDPKTKELIKDSSFKTIIKELQDNPSAIMQHISDPRVITALSVVMGVDLSGGDEGPAAPAAPPSAAKQAWGAEASPPPKEPGSKPAAKENPKDVPLTDDVKEALRLKDLGNDAYKAKNFDDALEYYKKANKKDPNNMSILTNMAAVFLEQDKCTECITKCEEAIDVGRSNRADFKLIAKAYARMGNAHTKLNQMPEALKCYQKSLSEHRDPAIVKKVEELETAAATAEA